MAQQKKVVVHPTATAPSPSNAGSPSPQGNYTRPSESDSTITNTTIVDESTFVGSPDDLEKGKPGIYQAGPHDDAVLRESEIEWHYLTFDTEVPQPAGHPPVELAPPNLKKFESPFLWSKTRKNFTTAIATYATALAAMASGAYNSASDAMQEKWHISQVVCEVGLTLFCVGFAIAPMFLAPFSEINGRRPLFIASGVLLVAASIGCGGTDSFAGMCVARFFAGVGGSTFSSIVGGVISDMYISEERNTPMSFFSAGALFGTGLGPLYTGFIAYNSLWRWVFYSQGIICGVAVAYMILFFPETRGGVLLSQKAKTLNNYYDKLEKEGFYGVYVPIDPAMPEKGTKAVRLRKGKFD
ncbi:hypothetical protein KEM55_005031 [Ascosphaera atra]|nr:hypothetical protein KEM55_005031 [Ascosphaera atra]